MKAIGTGRFWALVFFPFLSIIAIYMILVHNVKFLVDQGISKMNAALFFAAIGVISSIFRVIWGGLSDRIGRQLTYSECEITASRTRLTLSRTSMAGKWRLLASCRDRTKPRKPPAPSATKGITQGETGEPRLSIARGKPTTAAETASEPRMNLCESGRRTPSLSVRGLYTLTKNRKVDGTAMT